MKLQLVRWDSDGIWNGTSAESDQKVHEEMTLKCTLTKLKPGVASGIHMGGVVTFFIILLSETRAVERRWCSICFEQRVKKKTFYALTSF